MEKRANGVNALTPQKIDQIIEGMLSKKQLISHGRVHKCTLATTKDAKGKPKHAQVDIARYIGSAKPRKELVHLIYWRKTNNYKLIPADEHISHLDKDQQVLNLTSEKAELNESRKYCHLFGWYKCLHGETTPRCPHKENPCTGSQ